MHPRGRRFIGAFVAVLCAGAVLAAPAYSTTVGPRTVLPDLTQARVLGTRTASMATDTRLAGTRVRYKFDEPLDASVTPDPADFLLYDEDGSVVHADQVNVSGRRVTALFESLDTQRAASAQTLATTTKGAVADLEGNLSPIGATQIIQYGRVTGIAGCPVLKRVENFRVMPTRTKVDFAFSCLRDEVTSVNAAGFHLELVGGGSSTGLRRAVHQLSGIVTVTFPGRIRPRRVGRAAVDQGAVALRMLPVMDDLGNSAGDYETANATQSEPVSHQGHTSGPDLVRVMLHPSHTPDVKDHAIFVFDQRIRLPNARKFLLFRRLLVGKPPPTRGRHAVRVKGHPRWVRVSFDSMDEVCAAAVTDGAVRNTRVGGVDVTNSFSFTRSTPGWTSGPDLRFFGFDPVAPALTATFTFDEPLVIAPSPSSFHLYRRDGQEWDAQSCTVTSPQDGGITPVSCTFPSNAANALHTVFVATVDGGTVQDANGRTNPEGTAYGFYATCATDPYQSKCS